MRAKGHIEWLVTGLQVIGGAETFVRRTAPRLRQAGWDVRVTSLISGGRLVDELRAAGVPVTELGLGRKSDLGIVLRLARHWRRNPPALIHTHLYHAGVLGRVVARALRLGPVVVHQHGAEQNRSRLRTQLDRLTAPLAQHYVATCQAVASVLQSRERIPDRKIQIIYNGLDALPSPTAALPAGWPVPAGALSVACVGRLSPEKGQAWLLEALTRLDFLQNDVHTVIIGSGSQHEGLVAQSDRLGLTGRVHFTGAIPEVTSWLPHFDLFVLPSDWEGISLALLEAMAAGLPVVATRVGGTPEVVLDEVTGLLVPPRDPAQLVAAIQRLCSNPAFRQQMGRAGQERIRQHFSMDQTIQEIEQLYTTLLSQKRSST